MPRSASPSLSRSFTFAAVASLLALGATAVQAQDSATFYGLIDLSVGSSKAPGGTGQRNVNSGNMTTSFFGVKGNEDLGGGMSAVFALESFMRSDTGAAGRFNGDTFWARNSYVGLTSKSAGTLTVGRNTTALFVNTLLFNSFGDSFGFSPSIRHTFTSGTAVQVSGDTGWSDSVKYSSPNFGGFSFSGHVAAGEGDGGRNVGVSALYFGGPLAAGFAWQKVEKGTGAFNPDTTAWQLGASYILAPLKLYAQYGSNDNKTTDNTIKTWGLGADYTIGLGKVLVQYGQLSPDVGADQKTFSLGYDYQMSKRTDLYAVYMNEKVTGLSTGNSYAFGIRHRF
jgi:predicted porin